MYILYNGIMEKGIMTLREVAAYLNFSEKKIYNLVKSGDIPFRKIGGQYRFVKDVIDEWLLQETGNRRGEAKKRKSEEAGRGVSNYLQTLKKITVPFERRLYFVGILTRLLSQKNIRPILVGGNAVEFYTLGGYATGDVDIVVSDHDAFNKTLRAIGFKKTGRHWYSKELDLAVESPASRLAGDFDRLTEVTIKGLKAYVIGIEDIIIDRLNAFVHWKSLDDARWAKEMIVLKMKDIDWKYLEGQAKKEGTLSALKKIKKEAEAVHAKN